jgi:hypothetical protein
VQQRTRLQVLWMLLADRPDRSRCEENRGTGAMERCL